MAIKIGETVHLMGGDSGTVQHIYDCGGDHRQYQIEINGRLTWVRADVINEVRLEQQSNPICHYCGMPATDWDLFGAPVCKDCQ